MTKNHAFKEIGFLSRSKGLKGALKVSFEVFFLEAIEQGLTFNHLYLHQKGAFLPYFIEKVNWKGNPMEIQLEEVTNRNQANAIQNQAIFMRHKDIDPYLQEEELTGWDWLLDFVMIDHNSKEAIGKIRDILELPQHELAEVKLLNGKEILFPLNDDLIISIDEEQKTIVVTVPDGLLDL